MDFLDNKIVLPAVVGVSGLIAGFGAGYILGRVKTNNDWADSMMDEDPVDSVQVVVHVIEDELPDEEDAPEEAEFLSLEEREILIGVEESLRQDVEPQPVNIFAPSLDAWDEAAERATRIEGEPYVITADQYHENEDDLEEEIITYYAGDNIAADSAEKPIYNHSHILGELKFGHGSGDPNVVYIRNDSYRRQFEVLRMSGMFQVEVAGLEIEQEYEAADLKHSADRRFRSD